MVLPNLDICPIIPRIKQAGDNENAIYPPPFIRSNAAIAFALAALAVALLWLALANPSPARAQTPEPETATPTPDVAPSADTPTPVPADTPAPAPTAAPATQEPTAQPEPPASDDDVKVTDFAVSPDSPQPGDLVTVTATLVNFSDSEESANLELTANGVLVDSQSFTIAARDTRQVQMSFTIQDAGEVELAVGDVSKRISVIEAGPTRIPVPPTVRLRPNRTVIESGEDAIIDMFWDNSVINPQTYLLEVTVDVPIGLYLYSADGAMGCGAGTCKGLFEIPPANVRNLPMIVKADEVGRKFIHMNGRYFPQDAPEMWNPISLTVPIEVRECSVPGCGSPPAPTPVPTGPPPTATPVPPQPPQPPQPPTGGGGGGICNINASPTNPASGAMELAIAGLLLGALWVRSRKRG